MAESNRIVFPDEAEVLKEAAGQIDDVTKGGDSNSVEETVQTKEEQPALAMRNMIVVPPNCPAGYQMGADGVCREVFE